MVSRAEGRRDQDGWTLVELTIVISLITILAAIASVGYRSAIVRSKEAVLKEDLFQMREAIDQHYADKGEYPGTLEDLVTEKYLRRIPQDPLTGSVETWQTVLVDFNPSDPLAQGIFDVTSGSDGTALDGTLYVDW